MSTLMENSVVCCFNVLFVNYYCFVSTPKLLNTLVNTCNVIQGEHSFYCVFNIGQTYLSKSLLTSVKFYLFQRVIRQRFFSLMVCLLITNHNNFLPVPRSWKVVHGSTCAQAIGAGHTGLYFGYSEINNSFCVSLWQRQQIHIATSPKRHRCCQFPIHIF